MNDFATRGSSVVIVFLMFISAAGCGGDNSMSPPSVRFGEETCARCRMIVSDGRFAAAITAGDGEVLKFDDLGCLLDYRATHSEPVRGIWVGDYESADWLNAEHAVFVHADDLATPMASGLVALSTVEKARQYSEAHRGKVLRLDELAAARSMATSASGAMNETPTNER